MVANTHHIGHAGSNGLYLRHEDVPLNGGNCIFTLVTHKAEPKKLVGYCYGQMEIMLISLSLSLTFSLSLSLFFIFTLVTHKAKPQKLGIAEIMLPSASLTLSLTHFLSLLTYHCRKASGIGHISNMEDKAEIIHEAIVDQVCRVQGIWLDVFLDKEPIINLSASHVYNNITVKPLLIRPGRAVLRGAHN